ncbi:TPA: fimbrial protein [Salmonella enterica subsp. enterica serovar Stanley]|nr:fimbrial protein [Salmonella enterica subsp. enterica serovar Stanley]
MISAAPAFAVEISGTDAGHGTITFSGAVVEAPCSISPDSQNIQADLGQVSMKALTAAGTTSPDAAKIQINLSGCAFEATDPAPSTGTDHGQKSKVDVEFSNLTIVDATTGIIKNTAASNPANHVDIQLLRSDMTPFNLTNGAATGTATQLTPGANQLTLWARMISKDGSATAGNVGATITYKLKYF